MHHRLKKSPKSTTGMSSVAYLMLWKARYRSFGQQAIDTYITTMLQHIPCTLFRMFWPKNRLLWFIRLLILLIWLPVTSDCSCLKVGYFSNNENPTRTLNTTLLKCCLPSTDAIDRREKIHAWVRRFKVASCKCTSLKFTRLKKKKIGYFSNRPRTSIYEEE